MSREKEVRMAPRPARVHEPKTPLKRINQISLARFEQRVLPWMAARLPLWVTPDHLTLLALAAAIGIGISYGLTHFDNDWIWLASAGLILHWWGDSLDGTLARIRKIQRERYGFFLDHFSDTIAILCMLGGLGLSPLMHLSIALFLAIGYYAMSILVYLVSITREVFRISYFRMGPTEARLALISVNVFTWFFGNPQWKVGSYDLTLFDIIGIAAAIFMLTIFIIEGEKERRRLNRIDPGPQQTITADEPNANREQSTVTEGVS